MLVSGSTGLYSTDYVLVSFLSVWHKLPSLGKRKPQLRNFLHYMACGQVCGAFSWFLVVLRGPSTLWEVPSLGRWAWAVKEKQLIKPREHVSKKHSSTVTICFSSCLQIPASRFLPWLPSLMDCNMKPSKPFSHQCCLCSMFYQNNPKETRTHRIQPPLYFVSENMCIILKLLYSFCLGCCGIFD